MSLRNYLSRSSVTSHGTMVRTFARAMMKYWGPADIHVSCDTAIARGMAQSRLELRPMITWDAIIGSRQIGELSLRPHQRRYHRYLPFPQAARDALDEWTREKVRISLHHQLLTGVVIHVDTSPVAAELLNELEYSVVHKGVLLVAAGQYWRARFGVATVTARDDSSLVESCFERIWEARRAPEVMHLYYKYPETFEARHFVPNGLRRFVAYLQDYRCPCQNHCDLSSSSVPWHVDHVVSVAAFGTNVLINLQATCRPYNSERKRQRPEPRPCSYPNIMVDTDWRPRISKDYQALLLDQRLRADGVRKIKRLCRRTAEGALG